jgi:pyridoxal phosphate enzyme (YggS family)
VKVVQQADVTLAERKRLLEERVAAACTRVGRKFEDVRLIAVTKYSTFKDTVDILELGLGDLGESRWQEAKPKWEHLGERAQWHFIGHLQTNKVKDIIGKFALIHSLDRLSLAEELQRKAEQLNLYVDCLVQLNISGEQSKFGLNPQEVSSFFETLTALSRINVKGLMTMAPYEAPEAEVRRIFRELRELRDRLNLHLSPEKQLTELSMGMSDDFEIAIEEGATMIRLGSALMGERAT